MIPLFENFPSRVLDFHPDPTGSPPQPTRLQCATEVHYRIHTVHTDFACLAPNHTLSRQQLTIIINIVLCYVHLRVHFGIESHTQLALINKTWHAPPLSELSCKFIKGALLVGSYRSPPSGLYQGQRPRHVGME